MKRMNSTNIQHPSSPKAPVTAEEQIVLVRVHLPDLPAGAALGWPRANLIGSILLGEIIRVELALPKLSVVVYGELYRAHIAFITRLPPRTIMEGAIETLGRFQLDAFSVIAQFCTGEDCFRELHRGRHTSHIGFLDCKTFLREVEEQALSCEQAISVAASMAEAFTKLAIPPSPPSPPPSN